MKAYLHMFLISVLALFGSVSQALAQGPTISSTLGGVEAKPTQVVEFTISTTKGNAPDGTMVKGRMVLLGDNVALQSQQISLEYLETATEPDEWRPLPISSSGVAEFGSSTGFPLADATSRFRVTFSAVGTFNYTLELRDVTTNAVVASANETASVRFNEPTIDTTLDVVSLQDVIATGAEVLFRVYLEANERAGETVTTRLVLDNPADHNKFTLQYATNEAGTEFETLEVGEDGILVFGPAEGFELADMSQLFKINFSEAGTYEYAVQVLQGTDILSFSNETITVVEGNAAIASSLSNETIRKDVAQDFTITMNKGAWGADTKYRVRIKLDDPTQRSNFNIVTTDATPVAISFDENGVAYYGAVEGFMLTENTTPLNLEFTAIEYATYDYTLELLRVISGQDPQVIASSDESVVVAPVNASIASAYANPENIIVGEETTFTLTTTKGDLTNKTARFKFVLDDAAQANTIIMENTDAAESIRLIFGNDGVAYYMPAAGPVAVGDQTYSFTARFLATGTYNYTVQLIDTENAGAVLALTNVSVEVKTATNIKKGFERGRFAVYPTLTTGAVKIDLANARNANIQVVDMMGRLVLAKSNLNGTVELDLSKVAKGSYIIKIQDGTNVNTQRVVVR